MDVVPNVIQQLCAEHDLEVLVVELLSFVENFNLINSLYLVLGRQVEFVLLLDEHEADVVVRATEAVDVLNGCEVLQSFGETFDALLLAV